MLKPFSSYWTCNHFLYSFFCCASPYALFTGANLTEYALLIVTYLFNRFVMNEFPQEIVEFDNKGQKNILFTLRKFCTICQTTGSGEKMIMFFSNNKVSI
jgi:hypothetical protein